MKCNNKICQKSGREISLSNFNRHVAVCDGKNEKLDYFYEVS